MAMGWYEPVLDDDVLRRCMAAVNLPLDAGEVDPATFMPCARSVAFRREAIDAVGGYPEWLAIGEDMWVNQRWRELGSTCGSRRTRSCAGGSRRRSGRPGASTSATREGDAQAAMYPERTRCGSASTPGRRPRVGIATAGRRLLAAAGRSRTRASPFAAPGASRDDPRERAFAVVAVPALMAWIDAAKMAGYVAGLVDRLTGAGRPATGTGG